MFGDAAEFVKGCDPYQRVEKLQKWDMMPLQAIVATQPFEKWVIDFVGPISPVAKNTQGNTLSSLQITLQSGERLEQQKRMMYTLQPSFYTNK